MGRVKEWPGGCAAAKGRVPTLKVGPGPAGVMVGGRQILNSSLSQSQFHCTIDPAHEKYLALTDGAAD